MIFRNHVLGVSLMASFKIISDFRLFEKFSYICRGKSQETQTRIINAKQ